MQSARKRFGRVRLIGVVAAAVLLGATMAPASAKSSKTADVITSKLTEFAAGVDRGYDIRGPVRLHRGADWTSVKVNAKGLGGDETYGAHLHAAACDDANGGPHYQDDVGGSVTPPNELHLSIATNGSGNGHDASSAPWAVRDGARSVVIHDTDGARIACADLPVG